MWLHAMATWPYISLVFLLMVFIRVAVHVYSKKSCCLAKVAGHVTKPVIRQNPLSLIGRYTFSCISLAMHSSKSHSLNCYVVSLMTPFDSRIAVVTTPQYIDSY